jgi:hypothetical protein
VAANNGEVPVDYDRVMRHIQQTLDMLRVLIHEDIDSAAGEIERETFDFLVAAQALVEQAAERWEYM